MAKFDTMTGTGRATVSTPQTAHRQPTIMPRYVFMRRAGGGEMELFVIVLVFILQGDTSRCSQPPVDNKTKVVF